MSIADDLREWDAAIARDNASSGSPYSDLVQGLRANVRQRQEAKGSPARYVAILLDTYTKDLTYIDIPHETWPWNSIQAAVNENPNLHLVLGFDLESTFEEQFPEHLNKMQVWDYFCAHPLIWFPDQAGKVPARIQEEQRQDALRPRFTIV